MTVGMKLRPIASCVELVLGEEHFAYLKALPSFQIEKNDHFYSLWKRLSHCLY